MINADLPITNSSEDILNRGSFARSLAETITKQSFPASFTIGLYGAWGSGKTSLLNMILENIKKNDNTAVILRFNPWLCADAVLRRMQKTANCRIFLHNPIVN